MSFPEDLKKLNKHELENLCAEIRKVLIDTVSGNGGHLASNLGTVELTAAIHRVFNSPYDKIIWDVGHQAYTHKILTGRYKQFHTIRKEGGLSGFTRPSESVHDAFISGHASNSVSAACGFAEAMRIDGNDSNYAVAVIGDGAMTGGMVYEGLNNASKGLNLIVILNHNDRSISKNVGALSKHLSKIRAREGYVRAKMALERLLSKVPLIGMPAVLTLKFFKDKFKSLLYHNMFDNFGFVYLGPVDGHDTAELEKVLNTAKAYKCPVFVHVNTVKGKGYRLAEESPGKYHGVPQFDAELGVGESSCADGFSGVFGQELLRLAELDKNICAVTAAMQYSVGLSEFAARYKERFFDVGIAEQHAVTFCAGLASMGKLPVFAVYSSFLQRSYDQIIHDAAICGTHIVLCIDRAGTVGEDGETHHGLFDVSMLSSIPGITLYSPSCYEELRLCLNAALYEDSGVAAVRYPRGKCENTEYEVNTGFLLKKGLPGKTLIITYGRIYAGALKAFEILNGSGNSADLLKLTRILPLNEEIADIAMRYKNIYFFEEGSGIAALLAEKLLIRGSSAVMHIRNIYEFVKQADTDSILRNFGLDCESIVKTVNEYENRP
jgi:1-deoxy-D-xylulose-5-phosphate synthase